MINILIVDDSDTEIKLLKTLIEAEQDMHVIGVAKNGKEAIKMNAELKPDLITMDIQMPVMNGLEATRTIMSQQPTPIVVISSKLTEEIKGSFKALEAGALSVLPKPNNFLLPQFEGERRHLIQILRSMAEVKVIKRRFVTKTTDKIVKPIKNFVYGNYEVVAIGASVGGPQALRAILANLPKDFPVPILIVQHMMEGFINGFAEWLNNNIVLKVKYAEDHEVLQNGTVYFAPDHFHLLIERNQGKLTTKLYKSPPVSGFCPSITMLLQSVAKTCGKKAVGILLTGMGSDGAEGLLELKHAEGHTLIQDEESAVVFGMANVARSLGAADKTVELAQMAGYLTKIIKEG